MLSRRKDEHAPSPPFRGDVDALAARVDELARIVREASGSVVAVKGEVARSERSRAEDAARLLRTVSRVQDEVAELRRRPTQSDRPAPAPAVERAEELSVLADRVRTLSEMVSATAGQVAAREGGLNALRNALTDQGVRVDEALAEVRRDIAALATRVAAAAVRPAVAFDERLDGKVTALGDRLDTLADTVRDTAGAIAAADGERAREAARTATRLQSVETVLEARTSETRHAVAKLEQELRSLESRIGADPQALVETQRLTQSVETMRDRLETLAGIVRESAGRLATRDELGAELDRRLTLLAGEVTSLAAEVHAERRVAATGDAAADVAALDLDAVVAPLAETLERLARRVDALSVEAGDVDLALQQALAARVEHVEQEQEALRSQVAEVADEVATGHETLSGEQARLAREQEILRAELAADFEELQALRRELTSEQGSLRDELAEAVTGLAGGQQSLADDQRSLQADVTATVEGLRADVDAKVGDLRDDHEALARDHEQLRSEVSADVEVLRASHELLARDLETVSAVAQEALERDLPDAVPVLRELAARLERIEGDRLVVADHLAEAEAAWTAEREALQSRLAEITLSATTDLGGAGEDAERLVNELTVRLDRLERDRESVADIASLADGWQKSLGLLAARVEYGLIKLQQASAGPAGPADAQELVELATRVESMERDRDSVLGELERATESWAAERAALHERVAELAARIVTGPVDAPIAAATATSELGEASQELDRLRIALEGMRMRLAYHEKTVAEMGGGKLTDRLDDLSARLDRLQQIVATGAAGNGLSGSDVLIGLDVGSLLRRVEQAERASQEQRKDMLGHLEKIAARMDWRLQRLERAEARVLA